MANARLLSARLAITVTVEKFARTFAVYDNGRLTNAWAYSHFYTVDDPDCRAADACVRTMHRCVPSIDMAALNGLLGYDVLTDRPISNA